jgi:hypothetical protein
MSASEAESLPEAAEFMLLAIWLQKKGPKNVSQGQRPKKIIFGPD